jgi:putative SOS response-associated peptidase YedK
MREWEDLLSQWPAGASVSYNIAPTLVIPAFTPEGGHAMRWGLIPSWANEIPTKFSTYNARLETVASKPAYRHAWSHAQRCVIPILGYYEWRQEGKIKQPYFIRSTSGSPLVMAGLWEPGRGDLPASCTVITTEAAAEIAYIHPRMPLFVGHDALADWFDAGFGNVRSMLQQWPVPSMDAYKVSTAVNNPRADGAQLIDRAHAQAAGAPKG